MIESVGMLYLFELLECPRVRDWSGDAEEELFQEDHGAGGWV